MPLHNIIKNMIRIPSHFEYDSEFKYFDLWVESECLDRSDECVEISVQKHRQKHIIFRSVLSFSETFLERYCCLWEQLQHSMSESRCDIAAMSSIALSVPLVPPMPHLFEYPRNLLREIVYSDTTEDLVAAETILGPCPWGQRCVLLMMKWLYDDVITWDSSSIPPTTIICLKMMIFHVFYKSVTNPRTDGPTDRPTDRPTDGQTLL